MKSEIINEKTTITNEYPCLMITDIFGTKIIVLASHSTNNSAFYGTIIYSEAPSYKIGDTSAMWDKTTFKTFSGEIKLSQ
jgi:hypothetical protein